MPDSVLSIEALGPPPWPTEDPFLFCVHHFDDFPRGDGKGAPAVPLTGRHLGQDFANKDGWNMYHGQEVPGFPAHPHRGFETLTVVTKGLLDHADSLGAAARYGDGDAQWMTAGAGVVHSEMFPLLSTKAGNPTELFQIWINLPPAKKMAQPGYKMLWSEQIPTVALGKGASVKVVAGSLQGASAPPPPPDSWASQPGSDLAVWVLTLEAGAKATLPAGPEGVNRTLYYYQGKGLKLDGQAVQADTRLQLRPERAISMEAVSPCALLLLQGRPIGAPVANYGPFVMNTQQELRQAFEDYQRTRFGGWNWPDEAPVHGLEARRFAKYPDGREERP